MRNEMIRLLIFIVVITLSVSVAQAKDIQLFNPNFFGQPTSSSIKLLYDKKGDEIEPYMVKTDIKCGKYTAATAVYSKKVSFDEAYQSLNKLYKNYETASLFKASSQAFWRVTDKRFAVSLIKEDEGPRIMYIQFQPTKEIFKNIMKAQGANIEALEDNECKE